MTTAGSRAIPARASASAPEARGDDLAGFASPRGALDGTLFPTTRLIAFCALDDLMLFLTLFSMKNILVTGALGQIGSELVIALSKKKGVAKVVSHDNLQRALAGAVGTDAQLPARAARAGLELVGLRPCVYGEGRVTHIMYRHNGVPVSLFMLPRERRGDELMEVMGHNAAIWTQGSDTFVLVGREPRAEIERLAALVHGGSR